METLVHETTTMENLVVDSIGRRQL